MTIHEEVQAVQESIEDYVAFTDKKFASENDFVRYQLAGDTTHTHSSNEIDSNKIKLNKINHPNFVLYSVLTTGRQVLSTCFSS